jgi:hypothetical protein
MKVRSASAPWFQLPLREGGAGDSYAFLEPQAALFAFSSGIIPGTRFAFSRLHPHVRQRGATGAGASGGVGGVIDVSVVVSNVGTAGGSALVALYYSPPVVPLVLRYARRLVAFTRVSVPPGGSVRARLQVDVRRDLSRYDAALREYVVDAGKIEHDYYMDDGCDTACVCVCVCVTFITINIYLFIYFAVRRGAVHAGVYGLHVGDCCVTGVLPEADEECDERQVTAFVTL